MMMWFCHWSHKRGDRSPRDVEDISWYVESTYAMHLIHGIYERTQRQKIDGLIRQQNPIAKEENC